MCALKKQPDSIGAQVSRKMTLGLCKNEVAFLPSFAFAAAGDYAMMEK